MDEMIAVLLSWAIHLSPYPPAPVPEVELVSHQFLVDRACGGKECNVIGWYNDSGVIFIDEDSQDDQIIVHEFVHYLQHLSGQFDSLSCDDGLLREREAYGVQQKYALANGNRPRMISHNVRCNK